MNILESLTRLRDDLKLWVTNNLNVLNAKIDDSIIPIDDKLDDSSSNPIQNKVITKEIENLNTLIGGESVSSQIETAISQQEHFSGDYYDLVNAPNIIEDESGAITIADEQGKIIFKVDAYGAQSTAFAVDGINILSEINNRVEKVAGKGLSTNDFTDTLKSKLDGISDGAEVNQNAFSNVKVGSTTVQADSKTDTLELVAGSNVTLTPDATNDKVTIAATNTTTGTTYAAGSAPANTTFGTNGSIKNVYDNLNTKISNMNSHNNFVTGNLYFNVNKGDNNVAYFDIVDANGNGYRIGATNEGMWFQYMNNWQYGQYIWTQH